MKGPLKLAILGVLMTIIIVYVAIVSFPFALITPIAWWARFRDFIIDTAEMIREECGRDRKGIHVDHRERLPRVYRLVYWIQRWYNSGAEIINKAMR